MSVDVLTLRYDVVALFPDGATASLSPAVKNRARDHAPGEFAESVALTLADADLPGRGWLSTQLVEGVRLFWYSDEGAGLVERWRGTVFDRAMRGSSGEVEVAAYDDLYYLELSRDQRYYPAGAMAVDVIRSIADEWEIPVGRIDGPDVVMPRLVLTGSVGQMLRSVLAHGAAVGAGAFWLRMTAGQLEVVRGGSNESITVFEHGRTMADWVDRSTMGGGAVVTEVVVIGAEQADGRPPVSTVVQGDLSYGRLRDVIASAEYESASAAEAAARLIIDTHKSPRRYREVYGPDVPAIRKGDTIRVLGGPLDGYHTVVGLHRDEDARTAVYVVDVLGSVDYEAAKIEDARAASVFGSGDVSGKVAELLAAARTGLGVPYVWGGRSPSTGWDCSGFVQWAYAQVGLDVGSWTGEQQARASNVAVAAPLPGDLVFFYAIPSIYGPTEHVGIVTEDTGRLIQAGPGGTTETTIASVASGRGVKSFRRPVGLR